MQGALCMQGISARHLACTPITLGGARVGVVWYGVVWKCRLWCGSVGVVWWHGLSVACWYLVWCVTSGAVYQLGSALAVCSNTVAMAWGPSLRPLPAWGGHEALLRSRASAAGPRLRGGGGDMGAVLARGMGAVLARGSTQGTVPSKDLR